MVELQPSASKSETVHQRRPREHLTEAEIERLMAVARRDTRYGHRDATAILMAYRHGLRASEPVEIDGTRSTSCGRPFRIRRVKNGAGSTHYLGNSELRAQQRLQRQNPPGPHVFVSERGGPVTTAWFRKMMARLGERASMPFPVHRTWLRHSCAFKSPMRARTRARCRPISGTAISRAPCGTRR